MSGIDEVTASAPSDSAAAVAHDVHNEASAPHAPVQHGMTAPLPRRRLSSSSVRPLTIVATPSVSTIPLLSSPTNHVISPRHTPFSPLSPTSPPSASSPISYESPSPQPADDTVIDAESDEKVAPRPSLPPALINKPAVNDGPKVEDVFQRPLLYYRRSNMAHNKLAADTSSTPVQLYLPNKSMLLGFAPLEPDQRRTQQANEAALSQHLLVLTQSTWDSRQRQRVFSFLLFLLIPIDLVLFTLIYTISNQFSIINFTPGSMDSLSYAVNFVIICMGWIAIYLRESRLITFFIICFSLDAILQLMRIFSVLQICHFLLQMCIVFVTIQYRHALQPTWFAPTH